MSGILRKLTDKEAKYIAVLDSINIPKHVIAKRFGYNYMDVVNVLRGNCYNHVTGILQVKDTEPSKVIDVTAWLQNGLTNREVSEITGVEVNIVRNIRGYLKYRGLI